MSVLPNDYDSDPGRFLSTERHPHDDVHPYVARRFAAAGARTVLDVGGGNGRLARLLPALSVRCLLIDLSPAMLGLAPRPSARAVGARLPVADASVDAVAALFTLYHYADPLVPIREARRVLRPGGLFAACAPNRDSDPELARVIPGWGAASPFDGEDAAAIVASVFAAPGDAVQPDPWDGPLVTLGSVPDAAACLRVYGLGEVAAADAAGTLDLPLTLTKRGCVVYATKAPLSHRASVAQGGYPAYPPGGYPASESGG
jgi:SAM-dependent methyltransferase